ncbi:hypothetical protein DS65_01065, partial [Mesotoga sp. SC_4PWL113PWK15]
MKKLVGILVVLLAISVAFSATITLSPKLTGTLMGHVKLDKDGLDTDLSVGKLSVTFGAALTGLPAELTVNFSFEMASGTNGTASLNYFTVENDKAAASWYKAKSLATGDNRLNWFAWYDNDAADKTFVLALKELGLSFATQEGATDKIAVRGSWDIFSFAAQTGLTALKWSEDVIAEAKVTPLAGLVISGGVKATDLLGAATFNYVVDASYEFSIGLLSLNPYARYSDAKGQYVGLGIGYGIGILEITADVNYDIAANSIATWIQPVISKSGIGWAGVKFGYDYDVGAATQAMTLGFLVKSLDWAVDPVTLDVYVGSGKFTTKNDGNKTGFGYKIVGDVLADMKDISVLVEAGLDLVMGGFKPSLSVIGGYYFLDETKKLALDLAFPLFELPGLVFNAG